jgi:uncharacterized protein (DUF885 family)
MTDLLRREIATMTRTFKVLIAVFLFAITLAAQTSSPAKNEAYPPQLAQLGDGFMKVFFEFQPSAATRAGVHEYDSQLEDLSAERVEQQIDVYREWEKKFADLDTKGWSQWARADRDMMISFIRSRIFELQDERKWQQDPDHYTSIVSDSTFVIIGRNFGTPESRLRSLVEREKQMPRLFAQAKQNLKNPPKVFTQIAIEQLPGVMNFFLSDVPEAFADVHNSELNREFLKANAGVVNAMQDYLNFLKDDLLPQSNGDFRLGADKLRRKLQYEEMVTEPLDSLLAKGMANLRRNQQEFARVSKLIDPKSTPQRILASVEKEHPAPQDLLQAFRDKLVGMRQFCDEKPIITTPSRTLPKVQESPAYMRALSFASMDAPGPFETKATEAFFNVTLPERNATPQQVEEYMAAFNWGVITSTAIHEVIPGHYEQYLWNDRVPSRIRQFFSLDLSNVGSHFSGTNVEGWAHYTEQMMIDEGYGRTPGVPEPKDKAWLKLRLGQLQDALLRNARYIVAIQMHTGKMTFDQGVEFFVKEGYQTRENGFRETRRGTSDPTYLMYTLGKLQIMALRAEMKQREGAKFDLRDFHDEFMKQGVAPVAIIRQAMLGK